MPTTYSVIAGDTFENIARKVYGTEADAGVIARANPGAVEPLNAGTTLSIPAQPSAPQNVQQTATAANREEVAVLIDGVRFRFWDRARVTRSIDAVDTIELSAPFDPDGPSFKKTFRPFSFKTLDVTVGGDPLFTGTLVGITPEMASDRASLELSGYALPGVLGDCTSPALPNELEFYASSLQDIAEYLTAPFGISVEFHADGGAVFEQVANGVDAKVLPFLVRLAQQRGLVVSSSPRGALVFAKDAAGAPVARLVQGSAPVVAITPTFRPQEYYSHISGSEPAGLGFAGSQYTVKNSRLSGVVRPLVFNAPDTLDADVKGAVEAKAGRMFANAAGYAVDVATWRDPAGALWAPNTTVTLLAPGAMVYSEFTFTVRSVDFTRDGKRESATLNLMIPGGFSGGIPEALPWDE